MTETTKATESSDAEAVDLREEAPAPYGELPPREQLVAATMGKQLLAALVDELKVLQDPWNKTPQHRQQDAIFRLRNRIETLVADSISALAAAGTVSVRATVESVQFKDGVKAVMKIAKGVEGAHDLADLTGADAIIVMTADPREFLDGINDVKADPDQRDMLDDQDRDEPIDGGDAEEPDGTSEEETEEQDKAA